MSTNSRTGENRVTGLILAFNATAAIFILIHTAQRGDGLEAAVFLAMAPIALSIGLIADYVRHRRARLVLHGLSALIIAVWFVLVLRS